MRNTLAGANRRMGLLYPYYEFVTKTTWVNRNLEQEDTSKENIAKSSFPFIYDILLRIVDTRMVKTDVVKAMFKHLYIMHSENTFYKASQNYGKKLTPQLEFDQHKISDYLDSLVLKPTGEVNHETDNP